MIVLAPLTNGISGTERVVSDIILALVGAGRSVGLILPGDRALDSFAAAMQPIVHKLARNKEVWGRRQLGRNFVPTLQILRNWRPDLVHFHCPHHRWGLDVVLAARFAGVPRIVRTEHNPLMGAPDRIVHRLLSAGDRAVTKFTYVSGGNKRRFEEHLSYRTERGVVIPNGVDPGVFHSRTDGDARAEVLAGLGVPRDCKVAVFVGSIGGRRSLRLIFEAYRLLLERKGLAEAARQWRILAVGKATAEESALPGQFGIQEAVHFVGPRNNVPDILRSCDLFVSASQYEGMSIAFLEAWASGLPVLSTQVDGIADVVGDDAMTRSMASQEHAQEFADRWADFMQGEASLRGIHVEASARVRANFTSERMTRSYLELYRELGALGVKDGAAC